MLLGYSACVSLGFRVKALRIRPTLIIYPAKCLVICFDSSIGSLLSSLHITSLSLWQSIVSDIGIKLVVGIVTHSRAWLLLCSFQRSSSAITSVYAKITLRVLSDTFSFWHDHKNDSIFAIYNKIKYFIQLKITENNHPVWSIPRYAIQTLIIYFIIHRSSFCCELILCFLVESQVNMLIQ